MQQNAEKQLLTALSKFKLARDWVAINGCIQNIKEICLNFRDEIYDTPHTLLLSKTLSQCLSPSLPAGVQSSALDVYSLIFETAGEARLLRDFYIWAPGVLQFFHSAGVSQRVTTLKLFSDFFIPLIPSNHRLGPPLILSILPGLMDEGTEVQSLDFQALDSIKRSMGSVQFWRAMFRSALTHPNTRSAFLTFTMKSDPFTEFHDIGNNRSKNKEANNNNESNSDDSNDLRLVISLFTVLFNDTNFLIIRSALELFKNSYSKFVSDEAKSDLSLKCVNLLVNENKSIRRRVFQWITENINSKIVHLAVSNGYPEAVKAALEKGDEIKKMIVDNCLPMILSRGQEFDISIFFSADQIIDLKTLLKSASKIPSLGLKGKTRLDHELLCIDAQLRIIQRSKNSTPSEIRNELLFVTLKKFVELKKYDTKKEFKNQVALKLADLTSILIEGFDFEVEKIKIIGKEAIDSIFSDFKNIKTCIQIAVRLLTVAQIDADFNLLVTNTENSVFSFTSIDSLVTLSKINLSALIALDENVDKCINYCWQLLSLNVQTDLNSKRSIVLSDYISKNDSIHKIEGQIRSDFDHHLLTSYEIDFADLSELQILEKKVEICKILVQLYYSYPSKFAIDLDKNWDPTAVFIFITYTTEIPIPLLIVAQNKIKNQKKHNLNGMKQKVPHFDNFNLLRMICGHSQLILPDTKRLLSNASTTNDYDYMSVIIESLTDLVNVDNKLFIRSMNDSSLINFISLLLTFNSLSSNLLYSILFVSDFNSSCDEDCSSILSRDVLSEISGLIENYILSNVSDSWSFRLIIPVSLYLQDSSISAFIDLVPKHPSMLNALLHVLEKMTSSDSHFAFVDSLCQRTIELLNNLQSRSFLTSYFDDDDTGLNSNSSNESLSSNSSFISLIDEPLLSDISRLFKLIISRTETEILEARATVKSSTLRRILTSVEDLSNDNCIASLTVGYIIQDDSNTRYSSLAPKYLPQILSVAFNSIKILSIQSMMNLPSLTFSSPSSVVMNSSENNFASSFFASKFVVPFFLSFDNTWKLLFFYALSVANSTRMMQSIVSAIAPLVQDNQMAYYIKSLVQVLSYSESNDRSEIASFCMFIETLLYLKIPVFQTNSDPQTTNNVVSSNAVPSSSSVNQSNVDLNQQNVDSNPLSSLIVNIQSSTSIQTTPASNSGTFNPLSSTIEIIPVFASMFTQLHISPSNVIKLILTYQLCFPQVSLSALQVPFTNALNDAKTNQDELQSIISFVSMLDNKETLLKKSLFKSFTQSKITLLFTKIFGLCDKTVIQYPFFISKFVFFDTENTDWATTSVISMLSDPQFFQNGINYLSTAVNAIKNVSKVAGEKLVPLLFELFTKSSSDTGIMWINMRSSSAAEASAMRSLKMMSFVIFACEVDFFANKQQSINQQLLHFLSIVDSSTQGSANNSSNTSTTNMASSINGKESNSQSGNSGIFSNTSNSALNLNGPQNFGNSTFYHGSNQASSRNLSAFKTFALLMKCMFLRFSPKFIESFLPIITSELTCALTSDDDNIRAQAEVLLRAAIMTIPASFQFTEFAFIPDLITFPSNGDFAQNQRQVWPIIKESTDSLLHLAQPEMLKRSNFEFDLLREFLESIE